MKPPTGARSAARRNLKDRSILLCVGGFATVTSHQVTHRDGRNRIAQKHDMAIRKYDVSSAAVEGEDLVIGTTIVGTRVIGIRCSGRPRAGRWAAKRRRIVVDRATRAIGRRQWIAGGAKRVVLLRPAPKGPQ